MSPKFDKLMHSLFRLRSNSCWKHVTLVVQILKQLCAEVYANTFSRVELVFLGWPDEYGHLQSYTWHKILAFVCYPSQRLTFHKACLTPIWPPVPEQFGRSKVWNQDVYIPRCLFRKGLQGTYTINHLLMTACWKAWRYHRTNAQTSSCFMRFCTDFAQNSKNQAELALDVLYLGMFSWTRPESMVARWNVPVDQYWAFRLKQTVPY